MTRLQPRSLCVRNNRGFFLNNVFMPVILSGPDQGIPDECEHLEAGHGCQHLDRFRFMKIIVGQVLKTAVTTRSIT